MDRSGIIIFADTIRFFLVALASVLIGVVARVIQQYYIASRRALRVGDFRGLLPMHVWLIGSSYTLLLVGTMMYHIIHLGTTPDAYLAVNAAAYSLGLVALWIILRFQNRRVRHGKLVDSERRATDKEGRVSHPIESVTTSEFRIMRRRASMTEGETETETGAES